MLLIACNKDPASPEKNNDPKDGDWSGQTSQDRGVTFIVMNQGTEVDSGFTITMSINEWWGYGYAIYTRTVSTDIEEKKFSFEGSGISVQGEFNNRTKCEGNFAMSGTTGYPYYYSFASTGNWSAEWKSAPTVESSEQINEPNLQKITPEKIVEKELNENNKIIFAYYLKK